MVLEAENSGTPAVALTLTLLARLRGKLTQSSQPPPPGAAAALTAGHRCPGGATAGAQVAYGSAPLRSGPDKCVYAAIREPGQALRWSRLRQPLRDLTVRL